MTQEILDKLRGVYNESVGPMRNIIEVFNDQFGEKYVDAPNYTFEDFIQWLKDTSINILGRETKEADKSLYSNITLADLDKEEIRCLLTINIQRKCGSLDYFYITIWFPTVKVENEEGKSVTIQDLYAQVVVNYDGTLHSDFTLLRTTFLESHWKSDYAHSHLPGIVFDFTRPCYGSGPIIRTMDTIKHAYDLNIWGLFALELAQYVTVESLEGVPYRHLEDIGKSEGRRVYYGTYARPEFEDNNTILHDFLFDYMEHNRIHISFVNGHYILGESNDAFAIKLSNACLEFLEKLVVSTQLSYASAKSFINHYFCKMQVLHNKIYAGSNSQGRELPTEPVFTFKGNPISFKIIYAENNAPVDSFIFKDSIFEQIKTKLIYRLNYELSKLSSTRGNNSSEETKISGGIWYF